MVQDAISRVSMKKKKTSIEWNDKQLIFETL